MSQAPLRKQSRWSLWIPLGKSPDSHGTRCRRPRVAGHITGGFTGGFLPDMNDVHVSLPLSLYIYIYIYTHMCDLILFDLFMFFWYLRPQHISPSDGKKNDRWLNRSGSRRGPLKIWLCDFGCNQWHHGSGWWIGLGKSSPETHGAFTMKWIGFSG